MNFLCHAKPYLDNPLVAVSTGIPDWLSMVDRKVRARGKLAQQHVASEDRDLRFVAQGIIRHIEDDRWFHGTQAFVETNLRLAMELRELLPGDAGFRPTFVGHILIEMFLDAFWIRDDRRNGERYYSAVESICPATVERCVNTITGKQTNGLEAVIDRFLRTQFLYDYLDHDKLHMRLNQVMKRVRLVPLPEQVLRWLPDAQKLVESRREQLLTPPETAGSLSTIPSA